MRREVAVRPQHQTELGWGYPLNGNGRLRDTRQPVHRSSARRTGLLRRAEPFRRCSRYQIDALQSGTAQQVASPADLDIPMLPNRPLVLPQCGTCPIKHAYSLSPKIQTYSFADCDWMTRVQSHHDPFAALYYSFALFETNKDKDRRPNGLQKFHQTAQRGRCGFNQNNVFRSNADYNFPWGNDLHFR